MTLGSAEYSFIEITLTETLFIIATNSNVSSVKENNHFLCA